jgi:hypothetical protein
MFKYAMEIVLAPFTALGFVVALIASAVMGGWGSVVDFVIWLTRD